MSAIRDGVTDLILQVIGGDFGAAKVQRASSRRAAGNSQAWGVDAISTETRRWPSTTIAGDMKR